MSRAPFPPPSSPPPKRPDSGPRKTLRVLAATALALPAVGMVAGLVLLVSNGGLLHAYHVLARHRVLPGVVSVHIRNDVGRPVILALCRSDHSAVCANPGFRVRIRAGGTTRVVVPSALRTEWAVESLRGTLLRCLILHWHSDPGSTQLVRLSQAPPWADPCDRVTPVRP